LDQKMLALDSRRQQLVSWSRPRPRFAGCSLEARPGPCGAVSDLPAQAGSPRHLRKFLKSNGTGRLVPSRGGTWQSGVTCGILQLSVAEVGRSVIGAASPCKSLVPGSVPRSLVTGGVCAPARFPSKEYRIFARPGCSDPKERSRCPRRGRRV
jgi:hypothetical protein